MLETGVPVRPAAGGGRVRDADPGAPRPGRVAVHRRPGQPAGVRRCSKSSSPSSSSRWPRRSRLRLPPRTAAGDHHGQRYRLLRAGARAGPRRHPPRPQLPRPTCGSTRSASSSCSPPASCTPRWRSTRSAPARHPRAGPAAPVCAGSTGFNLFAWSMLAAPLMSSLALLWIAIEVTTVVSALLVAIEDTDGGRGGLEVRADRVRRARPCAAGHDLRLLRRRPGARRALQPRHRAR